jgi:hypothetical protein
MPGTKSRSVEGVLNGEPVGLGGGRRMSLALELVPWRVEDSAELCDVPLQVDIPIKERELDRWFNRLDAGAKLQVTVDRLEKSADKPWWLAVGRLPVRRIAGSALLRKAHAELTKPVVIQDRVLGRLELDRSLHWFEGKRRLAGRRYRLAVSQSGAGEDRARDLRDVERAKAIVRRLETQLKATLAAIARKMLPLYNDGWRDRRPAQARAAFLRRLRLSDIVIHSDGRATLYFKDGGLFLGHAVEVRVRRRGTISEICLTG